MMTARRWRRVAFTVVLLAAGAATAAAQPEREPIPVPAPADDLDIDIEIPEMEEDPTIDALRRVGVIPASEVEGAPRPGQASGISIDEPDHGKRRRRTAQVLLFLPHWILEIALSPLRFGFWAWEKYGLKRRFKSAFFNEAGTVGLFPTAFVEAGFGLNAGARLVLKDFFGHGARFSVRAGYGGRFEQRYQAKLSTGEFLGDVVEIELSAAYDLTHRGRFFGYGNKDRTPLSEVMPPVDPRIDPLLGDTAVKTRFRSDDIVGRLEIDVEPSEWFDVELVSYLNVRDFSGARKDNRTDEVYDSAAIVGWETGLSQSYTELAVELEHTWRTRPHIAEPTPSWGAGIIGFAGIARGFGDDPSDYYRYGANVYGIANLYGGDRVIALRLLFEGVTGTLAEVPFVDLPTLGGPTYLRGYDRGRFRDRLAGLASAEYRYPIQPNMIGVLFVDTGRVWSSYGDITLDGLRVGFGGGFQIHTKQSFIGRLTLSSSIDGGFLFNFSFDPVFDAPLR